MASPLLAAAALMALATGGMLWAMRRYINGYWFDRHAKASRDLAGCVALVTGGTVGGLGCAAAAALARAGARVVLTVRTEAKGAAACAHLRGEVPAARVSHVLMDLEDPDSVRAAAAAMLKPAAEGGEGGAPSGARGALERLDVLVLNAGVFAGPPERVWQANHLGHFLLVQLLTPRLLRTAAAPGGDVRIVAVSSGAHKRARLDGRDPRRVGAGRAYGQSKLAQIMHMRELQRRLRARAADARAAERVRCVAVTPGFVKTHLVQLRGWQRALAPLLGVLARTPEAGAEVIRHAVLSHEVEAGAYYSNCYRKQTEGAGGCADEPTEWARCWALSEAHLREQQQQQRGGRSQ